MQLQLARPVHGVAQQEVEAVFLDVCVRVQHGFGHHVAPELLEFVALQRGAKLHALVQEDLQRRAAPADGQVERAHLVGVTQGETEVAVVRNESLDGNLLGQVGVAVDGAYRLDQALEDQPHTIARNVVVAQQIKPVEQQHCGMALLGQALEEAFLQREEVAVQRVGHELRQGGGVQALAGHQVGRRAVAGFARIAAGDAVDEVPAVFQQRQQLFGHAFGAGLFARGQGQLAVEPGAFLRTVLHQLAEDGELPEIGECGQPRHAGGGGQFHQVHVDRVEADLVEVHL